jgi:hypothetical protein
MGLGLVIFVASTGLVAYDTFLGLGAVDKDISSPMSLNALKVCDPRKPLQFSLLWLANRESHQYLSIWQLLYVTSLACIKNSICLTMLKIATQKAHRIALYVTLGLSTSACLVGFIGLLAVCQPMQAAWSVGGQDSCAPRAVVIALNYAIAAGAVITDWACSIIPVFILWNAQMARKVKVSVVMVLSLGSLASISTLTRLPYVYYYGVIDDFFCELLPFDTNFRSTRLLCESHQSLI